MTKNKHIAKLRKYSLYGAVAMGLALSVPASAEEARQDFNIKSQSVSAALIEFANQSKLRVVASGIEVSQISAKAISGNLTPQAALKALLEDTGLDFYRTKQGALVIKKVATAEAEQVKTEKKPRPTPNNISDNTSSISGHVSEINTGSNVAGALVRIIETGQTTKTGDLGNFRFLTIVPGNYTLSISYLGFASRISEVVLGKGEEFSEEYSLGKALGELDEIVVFGSRSARAIALNLQRTAENNSEVVSADDLGNFTGTTISEALRRVSGVAFQRDFVTGDGTNIFIRGLGPDMNAIKLNGLNLPVGGGVGRAPDLGTILADSVSKITIHKSLLPSHDSKGTGGLVEIETKSPLNRPSRYVNLSLEGDRKGGGFGGGFLASGTVAGTFGTEENFGLSASVQYRERDIKNFGYDVGVQLGEYLPLETDGSLGVREINEVNPLIAFPFEPGADGVYADLVSSSLTEGKNSNLSVTLSAEWQVAGHTNLKFDYQHSAAESSTYRRDNRFITPLSYSIREVAALNGEERRALGWDGNANISQSYSAGKTERKNDSYSLRGSTTVGRWEFNYTLGYSRGSSLQNPRMSASFSSGGLLDSKVFDEDFLTSAAFDTVEGRIISPFGRRNGNEFALPLLTDAGWNFVNDPTKYILQTGTIGNRREGYNNRYTAKFSSKYNIDGKYLKYVDVGLDYETSKVGSARTTPTFSFRRSPDDCAPTDFPCMVLGAVYTLDELGLGLEESNLATIGLSGQGFSVIGRGDMEAFFNNVSNGEGAVFELIERSGFDARDQQAFTKENALSGYLQARVDIGKLEIVGGVRIIREDVVGFQLTAPTLIDENGDRDEAFRAEFERLEELKGSATDVLPRVQLNYRQNDNLVFRGSYYLSVARPSYKQLSDSKGITLSLDPGFIFFPRPPRLSIVEGNPDLKPANTHSFDASIEYYDDNIGLIKLSGFYKRTTNRLESAFSIAGFPDLADLDLPDHPAFQEDFPENTEIIRIRPENGTDPATIWGLEAHIERHFTFLPGFWNGFGVYANYNFTKSSSTETYEWFYSPVVGPDGNFVTYEDFVGIDGMGMPIFEDVIEREQLDFIINNTSNGAPRHSGTVALTYNKHDIDATLTYGFQGGGYGNLFAANNILRGAAELGTLDFRISYYFKAGRGRYRAFFEGVDLLKSPGSPDLERVIGGTGPTPKNYTGASYLGGRSFRLGLSATF